MNFVSVFDHKINSKIRYSKEITRKLDIHAYSSSARELKFRVLDEKKSILIAKIPTIKRLFDTLYVKVIKIIF